MRSGRVYNPRSGRVETSPRSKTILDIPKICFIFDSTTLLLRKVALLMRGQLGGMVEWRILRRTPRSIL